MFCTLNCLYIDCPLDAISTSFSILLGVWPVDAGEPFNGRYHCHLCLRNYAKKCTLLRHIRYECPYTSGTKAILNCHLCNYVTKRPDALKAHTRIHFKSKLNEIQF